VIHSDRWTYLDNIHGNTYKGTYNEHVHGEVREDKRTFSVNSSQVGILEQGYKVGLSSLLKRHHSRGLEAQVSLHSKHES
jgi:hypothetical protein